MNSLKKIVNIILFAVYSLFAIVQLNDPDGIVWFTIYALVALVCLYAAFKSVSKIFLWVLIILLLGYSLFHFTLFIDYLQTDHKEEIFGKMVYQKPYLEGSREFLGLLLASLGVAYQLKINKKRNP